MDVVAGVEDDKICSIKAVAHYANVEVAKREGGVAVVEDVILEIIIVNIAVEVANVEAVAHGAMDTKEASW